MNSRLQSKYLVRTMVGLSIGLGIQGESTRVNAQAPAQLLIPAVQLPAQLPEGQAAAPKVQSPQAKGVGNPGTNAAQPAPPQSGRIRLKNGDFVDGELEATDEPGFIAWKNSSFVEPLRFNMAAVRSVDAPPDTVQVLSKGRFLIQTHNGDRFWGDLQKWDTDHVVIESTTIGSLKLKSNQVRQVRKWGVDPKVLYQGPRSIQEWNVLDESFKWNIESGSLVSSENGAKVRGSIGLTERAQIDLRISWSRQPNFILAFGVGNEQAVPGNAFSLEVWDDKLALVRDIGAKSDAAYLEPLDSKKPYVELTIYLDQIAGRAIVFSDRGKQLADVTLAASNPKAFPNILFENYGRELRLDSIRVQPWNDQLPTERSLKPKGSDGLVEEKKGSGKESVLSDYVVDVEGSVFEGKVISLTGQELLLQTRDGKQESIPLGKVEELVQSKASLSNVELGKVVDSDPSSVKAAGFMKEAERLASDSKAQALVEYEKAWVEWSKVLKQYPDMIEDDRSKSIFEGINRYQKMLNADLPLSFPLIKFFEYRRKLEAGKLDNDATQWLVQLKRDASTNNLHAITAILRDQSRLIGHWKMSDREKIQILPDSSAEVVSIPLKELAAIRGSVAEFPLPKLETTREGQLIMSGVQISGTFATSGQQTEGTCLSWLPRSSVTAVRLVNSANGRVDFRRVDQRVATTPTPAQAPINQVRILGGRNQPAPATLPNIKSVTSPNVTLRTGDLISAEVQSISEKGITITSKSTTTTFIPNEQVQSVEIRRIRRDKTQAAPKMDRLLTVPRQKKGDPPTHLIASMDGDFLRGRLKRMDLKSVVMEVKLGEVEIPIDNIAQIVWLHDRKWDEEKKADAKKNEVPKVEPQTNKPVGKGTAFQVHAVERSGWKMTFSPSELDAELLHGKSDLLGDCNVAIAKIDLLLFGSEIDSRARELTTNPWTLSLAKQPKVYEDEGGESGDPSSAGTSSPLVGKPAQKLEGETPDGVSFKLADLKGKVVVLDFWASWCGPCMQTMPLVDAAVKGMESPDVELIAVNLEEPADRAKAAMERLKLDTKVVLDLDGVAAKRYQASAIPQTVIIDREGVVRHVFVGGGAKFVEVFKGALEKVLKP